MRFNLFYITIQNISKTYPVTFKHGFKVYAAKRPHQKGFEVGQTKVLQCDNRDREHDWCHLAGDRNFVLTPAFNLKSVPPAPAVPEESFHFQHPPGHYAMLLGHTILQ